MCVFSGSKINASWFALDSSRGIESPSSKLFMRSTVFVSEALIYIPAVYLYCQIVYSSNKQYLKKVRIECFEEKKKKCYIPTYFYY